LKAKYNNYTDEEVIHIFLENNDTEAIGILYKRYSDLTYGLMLKYIHDAEKSADLMMELFEKLPLLLQKHKIQNFKSWWYMTAKNHVLMHLRRLKVQHEKMKYYAENELFFMEFASDEHHQEYEFLIEKMKKALNNLNSEQRKCIELFYLKNLSYKEIENLTGLSFKEIKSHIQNGKRNLKLNLTENNNG
jgi:RNA polymerase sigma-70 factor (ECF subfamily)